MSKFAHFSPMPSFSTRSVVALEIAGDVSFLPGSDPRNPRKFSDGTSLTLSHRTRNFEMDKSRSSDSLSLKARIVRRLEAFDSLDPNRWLRTRRGLLIFARTSMPDSQPKHSCRSQSTISSLDLRIRLCTSTYNVRERSALEWPETVRIAQASEASRLSNPAPKAAAVNDVHDSCSPSTSFALREQSNFVNSNPRN